jgi:hypothetical protein
MKALAVTLALLSISAGPATQPAKRTYDCPRTAEKITLDGKLDEPAWTAAAWSDDFVRLDGKGKPAVRTRAKLTWDKDYFYVAAELQTSHVHATQTQRDANLYESDGVFEIFLDPDADARDYCELQFNALGTIMDLMMDKPYREHGNYDMKWDAKGMKAAVSVDGTLNNSSDIDRAWTVEIAIPWTALTVMAHRPCPPAAGDTWRIQLARCEHIAKILPDGKYERPAPDHPIYFAWSPQRSNNLHVPEQWGAVRFTALDHP